MSGVSPPWPDTTTRHAVLFCVRRRASGWIRSREKDNRQWQAERFRARCLGCRRTESRLWTAKTSPSSSGSARTRICHSLRSRLSTKRCRPLSSFSTRRTNWGGQSGETCPGPSGVSAAAASGRTSILYLRSGALESVPQRPPTRRVCALPLSCGQASARPGRSPPGDSYGRRFVLPRV